jgi:hypothetical protein
MKSFMVDLNLMCIFHLDSMFRVWILSFSYVNAYSYICIRNHVL